NRSASGAFDQSSFRKRPAHSVFDQIPGGGDFSRQINAIRINNIDYSRESQSHEASGRLYRSDCLHIARACSRYEVDDTKRAVFSIAQTFWTEFGQIPAKIAR